MTQNKGNFPSRKGNKKIFKKNVIKLLKFFLIITLLVFCIDCMEVYSGSRIEASSKREAIITSKIADTYMISLKNDGYENVYYEPKTLIRFPNGIYSTIKTSSDFNDILIQMNDYYATYYGVEVENKEFLFKTKEASEAFIRNLNEYDDENYTVTTTTKLIKRETENQEINDIIETKKREYEEKVRLERIAEEERLEAQKKQNQEQIKSTTNSGSNTSNLSSLQSYAHDLVINSYGWSEEDFNSLINLWNKESGWNPNSHNSSSGAHGIPQALPASKMASEGEDYYTNGETQIRWGLKYIKERYGSPSNAWAAFQSKGWY